ncbi:hypothetical protein MCEMRE182_00418 [Candidatus Nanopelagicaceae bacterium]
MRKVGISLLILIPILSDCMAFAEPPPGYIEIQDRLVIEACTLTSEKPHISQHVPGTVNVTGRTICKGISAGRNLRVTVTLTREDGGNTLPITKSRTGVGAVIVNVAMPCIWQRKQSLITYTISTTHKMSNGKIGMTRNKAALEC